MAQRIQLCRQGREALESSQHSAEAHLIIIHLPVPENSLKRSLLYLNGKAVTNLKKKNHFLGTDVIKIDFRTHCQASHRQLRLNCKEERERCMRDCWRHAEVVRLGEAPLTSARLGVRGVGF